MVTDPPDVVSLVMTSYHHDRLVKVFTTKGRILSMRALRISGPSEVEVVQVPEPAPAAGEVLIRIAYAGVCATDRKMARRGNEVPRIPGHEMSGWLEDGTPVGVHTDLGCGSCQHCREGLDNRCAERVAIGLDRDGGMAEWLVAPEGHILAVTGLELEVAALLEPLGCCLHASSLLQVEPDWPALVVGAGPMGILAMWALQAEGARVAICETSDARRSAAEDLGADGVLDPDGDPAIVLGETPLAAIVAAPGPKPLAWALERVEAGGRVHAFAGTPGGNMIDANVIHYRHLSLLGSTGSTMRDYRRAYHLVLAGKVPLDRLPRTVMSLDEVAASLRDPDAVPDMRSVIDMGRSTP
jgi:L-iditol 2-dehydrogenase